MMYACITLFNFIRRLIGKVKLLKDNASIFLVTCCKVVSVSVVLKFPNRKLRAYGGCLGSKRR